MRTFDSMRTYKHTVAGRDALTECLIAEHGIDRVQAVRTIERFGELLKAYHDKRPVFYVASQLARDLIEDGRHN